MLDRSGMWRSGSLRREIVMAVSDRRLLPLIYLAGGLHLRIKCVQAAAEILTPYCKAHLFVPYSVLGFATQFKRSPSGGLA